MRLQAELWLLLVAASIFGSEACTNYIEINEENYDRNYSSITSEGTRPLGFMKAVVPFNDPNDTVVCATITGVEGRDVEIAVETVPSMKICVKDQNNRGSCVESRGYDCNRAQSDTVTFTFYCAVSEGCSESDVTFWYRVAIGPAPEDDPEGMWCQWRTVEYPESLFQAPDNVIPPAPGRTTRPVSSGEKQLASLALLLTSLVALVMAK